MLEESVIDLDSEIQKRCNEKLLERIKRLRMDESFYDVQLIYPNSTERIPSVKKLLSIHSDYFKSAFLCEGNDSEEFELTLSNDNCEIPVSIFKILHNYIFTASLDIESILLEDQIKLFRLTKLYKFEDVTNFMVKYFILKMSEETCWELLNLSAESKEEGLGDECAKIITDLPDLVKNSRFLSLNEQAFEFLSHRNVFTLRKKELVKIKEAWDVYNVNEIKFKEIAAEITRKSHERIENINLYFKKKAFWKVRDPSILPIMTLIIIHIGLSAVVYISTLLGMGAIAYFSGITVTLAVGGPILVVSLGATTVYIGYIIYSKRAVFRATTNVLKLAEQKFDQLPNRVRANNVELEKLIEDSIKNILIDAFHISQEEMRTALIPYRRPS